VDAVISQHNCSVVDETSSSLIIEAIGSSKELAILLSELNKFGVKELVQSGLIAMETGDSTLAERTLQETGLASSESHSQTEDYQN
jgi:acetolactate synthase-1/3 small subunit